jgi:dTDP-4-dehydrorhamnose 3,5-epimerase
MVANVPRRDFQPNGSLLDQTLAAARRDRQTVAADGRRLAPLLDGVSIRDIPTQMDERGSLFEVFDARWDWHPAPLVQAHCFTIRPGMVKGWVLHETYDDRTMVLAGDMLLVLFDPRPDSSSCGKVCEIFLSGERRQIVNTPKNVWHAAMNVGDRELLVIDLPTAPYDHANPDKHRLPVDTPLIPYSFGGAKGW